MEHLNGKSCEIRGDGGRRRVRVDVARPLDLRGVHRRRRPVLPHRSRKNNGSRENLAAEGALTRDRARDGATVGRVPRDVWPARRSRVRAVVSYCGASDRRGASGGGAGVDVAAVDGAVDSVRGRVGRSRVLRTRGAVARGLRAARGVRGGQASSCCAALYIVDVPEY